MILVSHDIIDVVKNPLTKKDAHIFRFTMVNEETGMQVEVISYGATVYSLKVKDESGSLKNVVLGYDKLEDYESEKNPYFGATVGRVCNRINKGIVNIDGKEIQLTQNHGEHHLHGGLMSFSKIPWGIKEIHADGVSFCHISKHNSEGYPGEMFATVRYSLLPDNSLRIHMSAVTRETTIVNMTNHMYFNLAGHNAGRKALYDHTVEIYANGITETDSESIPTGRIVPVVFTGYDLRTERNMGAAIKLTRSDSAGFDDNFCIDRDNVASNEILPVAKASHPSTGLWMEVYSNQPGVQFYTANYFPDDTKGETPIKGKKHATYVKHSAFCLETQKHPDAPNHPNFPSILLRPDQIYEHIVIYKFGVGSPAPPQPRSALPPKPYTSH